ncbi:hypothetical protein COV21_03965 [Candidatus Woesearchaeota archaeon CG10_big_fil_rev_8_21_14_0_10_45_5]|nr:MAG: hypothetical protein COV21_03965 [Candidatus Woesearchaeota archaeon CG10_big_fil_rev_8_21_14_0_10_45_5]PIU30549.1 MAG: hypothetical protein COT07_00170 [Candidatus Woesearchaeota archaeon CG07_land_8_20_14_0_80_44_23]
MSRTKHVLMKGLVALCIAIVGNSAFVNSMAKAPTNATPVQQSSDVSSQSLDELIFKEMHDIAYKKYQPQQKPAKKQEYIPQIYCSAKTDEKVIAITIDDLYDLDLVREALSLGDKYGVKFTFFPIGKTVKRDPELYKELLAKGHEIELHTYTHAWATNKNVQGTFDRIYKNYADDINTLRDCIDPNLVFHFARPPGGAGYFGYSSTKLGLYEPLSKAIGALEDCNFGVPVDVAIWSGDSMFVNGKLTDSEYVLSYFKKTLSPGKIFLYHTREADFSVMEDIIKYAKSQGYTMVTLESLLGK